MGVVSFLWVTVGFSLVYGEDIGGVIGSPSTYFFFNDVGSKPEASFAPNIPLTVFGIFTMTFAVLTPAVMTGSLAERVDFHAYILFATFWSITVYCPLAHSVWHPEGFLKKLGYLDFAGGIPVEMVTSRSVNVHRYQFIITTYRFHYCTSYSY